MIHRLVFFLFNRQPLNVDHISQVKFRGRQKGSETFIPGAKNNEASIVLQVLVDFIKTKRDFNYFLL